MCSKPVYSKRKAEYLSKHTRGAVKKLKLRVYFCNECHGYHLTSQSKNWTTDGVE